MYKRILIFGVLCGILALPVTAELSLSSLSAVVIEADSGEVLYEKDAHTARPMASTTKLMTALLAAETLPLDREVTVSASAVAVEGSALGLRAGDKITVADLLTGLLLESGNDAANVTAEAVAGDLAAFSTLMNQKAAALGMKDSFFVTPSGLDAAGHAASAYDMALLGRAVLQNPFLKQVCATKSTRVCFGNPKREVWVNNHNRLLKLCGDCIGMKTGFTKRSGKCLVSAAERDGVTVVAATLNGGDYWNDHLKLYDFAFSALERVSLSAPDLPQLPIVGGEAASVSLSAAQPLSVTVHKDNGKEISVITELPRFVWAPIAAGETVGQITYMLDGKTIACLPVTAGEAIAARPLYSNDARLWRNFTEIVKLFFR